MPNNYRKEKMKIGLDLHNLSTSSNSVVRTGIQQVVFNLLEAQYYLGEKMEKAEFFCGRTSIEKFPYCQLHLLYAYQPKNAKEDDIVTDEDVPKFIEKKIKSA